MARTFVIFGIVRIALSFCVYRANSRRRDDVRRHFSIWGRGV